MNLSFKETFVEKIKNGSNIHTIRADPSDRWNAGNKIHFISDLRTKEQKTFLEGVCYYVQDVFVSPGTKTICIDVKGAIGWTTIPLYFIDLFAINDGFDCANDLFDFFCERNLFSGKIIHWTKLKYDYNRIHRGDGRL